MVKLEFKDLISFLLISIGTLTTIIFGLVPLFNILDHYNLDVMWGLTFWIPFGISSLLFGTLINKIKSKKFSCFSFIIWGFLILSIIYFYANIQITLLLFILIGIFTGSNVIIGTSYLGSNIQINKRGMIAGIYLGVGWAICSVISYISFFDLFLNIFIIAILNIGVGFVSYFVISTKKLELEWEPLVTIPRDYNVKRNGLIYWESQLIFGMFLGITIYLLGLNPRYYEVLQCFYTVNFKYYVDFTAGFGLDLLNLDFLIIGGMNIAFSPILGKILDKYGRKRIVLLSNLLIPAVLVLICFWEILTFLIITVVLYSMITASFMLIMGTVWSDLAPRNNVVQFNGYGWSSVAFGGSFGFIIANFITLPGLNAYIDTMFFLTILLIIEGSLIPFVFMKESLPPSEEVEWAKQIIHIYVINEGGVVLIDYPFKEREQIDPNLFSGGILGVSVILQEMMSSERRIEIIDHQDKKLLFEYGSQFYVALLAAKNLRILRTKLKSLVEDIHNVFWEIIEKWTGDIEVFYPINTMIRHYFTE